MNTVLKKSVVFVVTFLGLMAVNHLVIPTRVFAHCPLCVAGAGIGLSLSRVLGIDDVVTGIWMAAFLGAMALWTANIVKKQFILFQKEIIYISFFALTLASFYSFDIVDIHARQIFGLHRLSLGMIAGSVLFFFLDRLNIYLKSINGKVLFPYQGVIVSLAGILLFSIFAIIYITYLG